MINYCLPEYGHLEQIQKGEKCDQMTAFVHFPRK